MGPVALRSADYREHTTTVIRLPRAGLGQVWLVAGPAMAALIGGSIAIEPIDVWWCLLLGSTGSLSDPVVFTPLTGPTANVQWLAQRALAEIYALGGLGALPAVRAIVLTLTAVLVQLLVLRAGGSPLQAGLAAILALPGLVAGAALRPQLFAMPLFALVLLLGGPYARWRGSWPAVAVIAALWANVHGSFILAPLALGLLALGAPPVVAVARLRLAAIAVGAALLNPWGAAAYLAVLEVTRSNRGATSLAPEWWPLEIGSALGIVFLLQVAAAGLGVRRLGRSGLTWVALALPLGLLAIGSGRHTLWFAMAVAPLAAHALGWPGGGARRETTAAGVLLAGLLLLGAFGVLRPLVRPAETQLAADTPVQLADRLEPLRPRRVFAFSDWSGYLAWRLRPDARLYVDNRFEQHPDEVWASYRSVSRAEPGWERVLDDSRVDALALESRLQAPLIAAANASSAWQLIHSDERTALFVRS